MLSVSQTVDGRIRFVPGGEAELAANLHKQLLSPPGETLLAAADQVPDWFIAGHRKPQTT